MEGHTIIDKKIEVIDLAEDFIRVGGYNGFTLRDIATELGVKEAEIKALFLSKEALVKVVAERYSDKFFAALGEHDFQNDTAPERLHHYCKTFRTAFIVSGKVCLCGALSNEAGLIPSSLKSIIGRFVAANIRWLEQALTLEGARFSTAEAHARATLIYGSLETSQGVATPTQEEEWLEKVSDLAIPA